MLALLGIDRLKRKFADPLTKLYRICRVTGNIDKMKNILKSRRRDVDINEIKFVRL
jgi:hypothetical protein